MDLFKNFLPPQYLYLLLSNLLPLPLINLEFLRKGVTEVYKQQIWLNNLEAYSYKQLSLLINSVQDLIIN